MVPYADFNLELLYGSKQGSHYLWRVLRFKNEEIRLLCVPSHCSIHVLIYEKGKESRMVEHKADSPYFFPILWLNLVENFRHVYRLKFKLHLSFD